MATINFVLPTQIASVLNVYVPGFAAASGGGDTIALQVPSSAVPDQVAANLSSVGIQVAPGAAPVVSSAAADGSAAAPVVSSAAADASAVALPAFAPAGLVPQGAALEDPSLAGANAFAQNLSQWGEAANAFFQQAAANPPPANLSELATWASAQQQAVADYFGGL